MTMIMILTATTIITIITINKKLIPITIIFLRLSIETNTK